MKTPTRQRDHHDHSFVTSFYSSLGNTRLAGLARARRWSEIVNLPMPDTTMGTDEFRDAYYASEAFSKFPFEIPGVNREAAAFAKFREAEGLCKLANSRLVDWESRVSVDVALIRRVRSQIAAVLGEFSWDHCVPHFSFGPGASTSLPARKASHGNKWAHSSQVTTRCLPLYLAYRAYCTGWDHGDRELRVVAGNKVTTVPKNAKTDRVIAIEPDWNMFFQRGIGGFLRHRLQKRLGLLLADAQETNRQLAREGSATGRLATIDLSMASDSVSLALCEAVLPPALFAAICTCRSEEGMLEGESITYEKVSSMGNGFTFELETLIFWAFARACTDGVAVAYGDDIVIEARDAPRLIEALTAVGFAVNAKKTFLSGPFRESCGGHYHNGFDVTPPYFKVLPGNLSRDIHVANAIAKAASRKLGWGLDGRFHELHRAISNRVPETLRGPSHLGDAVLWSEFADARPSRERSRPGRPRLFYPMVECLVASVKEVPQCELGAMWASVHGRLPTREHHTVKYGDYRRTRVPVTRWEGPGPWLDQAFFG